MAGTRKTLERIPDNVTVHELVLKRLRGILPRLQEYRSQILLVVNVAVVYVAAFADR